MAYGPNQTNIVKGVVGSKTVTTAGTPERLSVTHVYVKSVLIYGLNTNTDVAFADLADAAPADGVNNVPVEIKPPHENMLVDLYNIWIDVAVNGEGVRYQGLY
jgi:hypothetical protein